MDTKTAQIIAEAHAAASAAIRAKFAAGDVEAPYNCGFAWVTIPGTSGLARACRKAVAEAYKSSRRDGADAEQTYGDKGYPRGWQWWGPGHWPSSADMGFTVYTQDMDFKVAAARAFAGVLNAAFPGLNAAVGSRLD